MRWSEADLQAYLARRGTAARPAPSTTRRAATALSEEELQRSVFAHLRARGAPGAFAFHPRNGSRDQRSLAGINAGLGVVSGVPDVIIIKGGAVYGLELKTERGKLSGDQTRVLHQLRAAGCDTGCAYGLDEALRWLEERGLLRADYRSR
jgi:hypothetical protein